MVRKILVGDDDKNLVKVIKTALEIRGFEVVVAYDGEETLQKLKTASADLIILDILMPKLNGLEVLQRIKVDSKFNPIPVIILTVKNGNEDMMKGYKFGADYYLPKPFRMEELLVGIEMMFKY